MACLYVLLLGQMIYYSCFWQTLKINVLWLELFQGLNEGAVQLVDSPEPISFRFLFCNRLKKSQCHPYNCLGSTGESCFNNDLATLCVYSFLDFCPSVLSGALGQRKLCVLESFLLVDLSAPFNHEQSQTFVHEAQVYSWHFCRCCANSSLFFPPIALLSLVLWPSFPSPLNASIRFFSLVPLMHPFHVWSALSLVFFPHPLPIIFSLIHFYFCISVWQRLIVRQQEVDLWRNIVPNPLLVVGG